MNKRDKIDYLLSLIKEKTDELLEYLEIADASAEEILAVSIKEVLQSPVIHYTSPIGTVDKSNVVFVIDKNIQIGISNQEDDDEN